MKVVHIFYLLVSFPIFISSMQKDYEDLRPSQKISDSEKNTFGAVIVVSEKKPEIKNDFCEHVIKCVPPLLQERIQQLTELGEAPLEVLDHIERLKKVVLYGPPGTGKTTAARVLAQKIGRPYMLVQTGMLANEYAHSGSSGIKRIMNAVIAAKGSVIVDEVDVIAKKKSKSKQENDREETAQALWQVLDEVQKNGLVFIGTTNDLRSYPEPLQKRFAIHLFEMPIVTDLTLRKSILTNIFGKVRIDSDKTIDWLNKETKKECTRAMENIIAFAVGKALLRNKTIPVVTKEDLKKAVEKYRDDMKLLQKSEIDIKEALNYASQIVGIATNIFSMVSMYRSIRHNERSYMLSHASYVASLENADESHRLTRESMAQTKQIAADADQRAKDSFALAKETAKNADSKAAEGLVAQKASLELQKTTAAIQTGVAAVGIIGMIIAAPAVGCTIS